MKRQLTLPCFLASCIIAMAAYFAPVQASTLTNHSNLGTLTE